MNNKSHNSISFMENYTTYLDNVVELILYKIFSKLSPNILMSNIMPPLLQDDIISHIEHAISQEDLKQTYIKL